MNTRAHPLYDGHILITDTGRVIRAARTTRRGNLKELELSQRRHYRNGYWLVQFELNGANYTRLVHQLVLETFVGPRPSAGHEACHGPRGNVCNEVTNLRWDTREANQLDQAVARAAKHDPLAQ